jgi:uncharacterized 2Fe-2S/4Fe-4S cluster protein (DUF4445 family)
VPHVRFLPINKVVSVEAGTTVLEAARIAKVPMESPCNGNGTCGKCKVKRVDDANLDADRESDQDFVLACRTEVQTDIIIELIERHDSENVQILSYGQSCEVDMEPFITKKYGAGDDITEILVGGQPVGSESGDTTASMYGLAVDIGTTTLVASLMDMNTGQEIASISSLNPQSRHAQDVLSRIKYASAAEGLDTMYCQFCEELNRMVGELTTKSEISAQHIYEIVYSGNTCMLHLATGTDPYSLGKYPYTPALYGGTQIRAEDHKITISPFGVIYLPPIISAYVGADITAGILAARLKELQGVTLFIDIGTNGEMVLAVDGSLVATSTAAGPAFEETNIACGMRAAPGAIERFRIGLRDIEYKTIGDQLPVGICGSGLLDIIGELVANGVIAANGKFVATETIKESALTKRVIQLDGKPAFAITDQVHLSQKDIRQVQLAKGAIRAGVEALLSHQGIKASAVDHVFIAGSFGYHLNMESLIHIGLLPEEFRGKMQFLGNTSKTGGQAFLLNQSTRRHMENLVKEVRVLELATLGNFDRLFVSCLNF